MALSVIQQVEDDQRNDKPKRLDFEEASGRVRFTVPAMGIYSMIVVAHE